MRESGRGRERGEGKEDKEQPPRSVANWSEKRRIVCCNYLENRCSACTTSRRHRREHFDVGQIADGTHSWLGIQQPAAPTHPRTRRNESKEMKTDNIQRREQIGSRITALTHVLTAQGACTHRASSPCSAQTNNVPRSRGSSIWKRASGTLKREATWSNGFCLQIVFKN